MLGQRKGKDVSGMDRRDFLKTAVIAGAAVAGAGALTACSSGDTVKWDRETDVLVVGAGGTGLAAACEAVDNGAKVLVIEKSESAGGTTAMSGGVVQAAGTELQKSKTAFQDDTPENHANYYIATGEGLLNEEIVRDFTAGAPEHIKWMGTKGVTFSSIYGNCHVPYVKEGLLTDRIHVPDGPNGGMAGGGAILTNAFYAAASDAGAEFEFNSAVTKLITDPEKGVIGVEADINGETLKIKANRGVVLACGGIDQNVDLARELNPQHYWDLTKHKQVITAAGNTGDGITMGLDAGAALAGVHGTIDFDPKTGIGTTNAVPQIPCVFVDQAGLRFVCEDGTYAYTMRGVFNAESRLQGDSYMILDTAVTELAANPFGDMDKAVSEGVLVKADSLEALAAAIAVPAENLTWTMARWNADIASSGKDLLYGRNTQLVPLNRPPYYAYKLKPMNLGSIGGLKINVDAQVIDRQGEPIPHLFCGGLNAGGWIGPYYPGSGTAIMGTIHFGRKAGASAAKAEPVA